MSEQVTKVKWGFIGCGEVTEKKSGPAFNMVEGSEVIAVMSRRAEKAKSYAERHHVPRWYTDPQERKVPYVEKPLSTNYEDCARINRISENTGIPCFVAYYRRYLPYFQKVKDIIDSGTIGNIINVQIRFSAPPRDMDYNAKNLPWRVQPDIAGGGYFFDMAPHQLDLLQWLFGPITEADGFCDNRGKLYKTEDTVSACFKFFNGLPGSGSWCFVGHESAKEDRVVVIGNNGQVCFSVYNYTPISLYTEKGHESIEIPNPPHVQLPLIRLIVEHIQQKTICTCDSYSATSVNWVMDRILGKL